MADTPKKFRIKDDPTVRELYSSHLCACAFDGANVSITFGALRMIPERAGEPPKSGSGDVSVYINSRIALSPNAAVELMQTLQTLVATFGRPTDPKQNN